jgi:hypothetical protein
MCRFQTSIDIGFSIVSRRLKLVILGEQIPSLRSNMVVVKKMKGKVSDILESSQSYNSQYMASILQFLLLTQRRELRSIYQAPQ